MNQILIDILAILIYWAVIYGYKIIRKTKMKDGDLYLTYSSLVKLLAIGLFINYLQIENNINL
jgi:hypothetical protein